MVPFFSSTLDPGRPLFAARYEFQKSRNRETSKNKIDFISFSVIGQQFLDQFQKIYNRGKNV